MCYHSGPKWTWEQWQWRGALHSPKLQYHWNLTIRLFSVIHRTLIGGVLPLCRGAVGVFYSPSQLGKLIQKNQITFTSNFKKMGTLYPRSLIFIQLARIRQKVISFWGSMHESRLMRSCHKKYLIPSHFPFLGCPRRHAIKFYPWNLNIRFCFKLMENHFVGVLFLIQQNID